MGYSIMTNTEAYIDHCQKNIYNNMFRENNQQSLAESQIHEQSKNASKFEKRYILHLSQNNNLKSS